MLPGSGPLRKPVSRASIWASSAALSSKSKMAKFSAIRCGVEELDRQLATKAAADASDEPGARCAAVSCGTATQGWRSASRCGSRTRNAPTDKRTALPRTPRVVWPSSTLSSPLADETRRRAVPECVGQGVLRSKIAMCKYWFKTPWLSPLFGRMARLPKGVPAWCGTLRGPWPT
jgi:hypothetical protein